LIDGSPLQLSCHEFCGRLRSFENAGSNIKEHRKTYNYFALSLAAIKKWKNYKEIYVG